MSKVPKCPNCGQSLTTVQVERVDVLEWDSDEKEYYDNGQGSGTATCGKCGKAIGGYGNNQPRWGIWIGDDGIPFS